MSRDPFLYRSLLGQVVDGLQGTVHCIRSSLSSHVLAHGRQELI